MKWNNNCNSLTYTFTITINTFIDSYQLGIINHLQHLIWSFKYFPSKEIWIFLCEMRVLRILQKICNKTIIINYKSITSYRNILIHKPLIKCYKKIKPILFVYTNIGLCKYDRFVSMDNHSSKEKCDMNNPISFLYATFYHIAYFSYSVCQNHFIRVDAFYIISWL